MIKLLCTLKLHCVLFGPREQFVSRIRFSWGMGHRKKVSLKIRQTKVKKVYVLVHRD